MQGIKKGPLMILGGVLLALAAVFAVLQLSSSPATPVTESIPEESSDIDEEDTEQEAEIQEEVPESLTEETLTVEEPYISPIDFEALWEINSDICAWLEIPGMDISAPIVNREGDNSYYLRRDSDGNSSSNGSFFIEDYNSIDFTDPVTVVYGHNMRSGAMFGRLQENYSNAEFFAEYNTFQVYTPDAEYDYQIFAAVPYSNKHILYYHNFSQFPVLEKFLDEVYSTRSLIANFDTSIEIEEGDRIVIFSVCLDGDNTQRYLVMGVSKNVSANITEN